MSGGYEIEAVRNGLGGERAEDVMAFWGRHGALGEGEAARRLTEVVCLLRGPGGEVAGVNSVYAQSVPLIAGREFWVYRSFLEPGTPEEEWDRMVAAAFELLAEEFDPAAPGPLGLCLFVERDRAAVRPEAEWRDPRILYAGYLPSGQQVRIGYFEGAKIGPGSGGLGSMEEFDPTLAPGYRIGLLAETDGVGEQDVLDLWTREGVVPAAEATRRLSEVLLVGCDDAGGLAGVSSAYLQRNAQLGLDLWYYRAFVAPAHRRGNLAVQLALTGRDHLERRHADGEDTRGAGLVYEVENEGLKRHFNDALWLPTDVTFIGENERGDHVRVRYHPGAAAPPPPSQR